MLADIHTVSQATISRVVTVDTSLIAKVLQAWVPEVGDLDPDRQYIIDGTLGALLVVTRTLGLWLGQAPRDGGEPADGLHPRRDPPNHQWVVLMMRRPSRNPDSSQHLMPRCTLKVRAISDWD